MAVKLTARRLSAAQKRTLLLVLRGERVGAKARRSLQVLVERDLIERDVFLRISTGFLAPRVEDGKAFITPRGREVGEHLALLADDTPL